MEKAMPSNEGHDHPCLLPATVDCWFGRSRYCFRVGSEETNTICVESSLWTGLRTYSINAAGISTSIVRGPCRFEVGDRERHEVVVQLDNAGRPIVLVDGETVKTNLFPRLRAVTIALVFVFVAFSFVVIYTVVRWVMGTSDYLLGANGHSGGIPQLPVGLLLLLMLRHCREASPRVPPDARP